MLQSDGLEKAEQRSRYHQALCTAENPQRKSLHGLTVKPALQLEYKTRALGTSYTSPKSAASHSGLRHPLSPLGLAVCCGLTAASTRAWGTLCVPAAQAVPCAQEEQCSSGHGGAPPAPGAGLYTPPIPGSHLLWSQVTSLPSLPLLPGAEMVLCPGALHPSTLLAPHAQSTGARAH